MAAKSRPIIIAGNWKMYKSVQEALAFLDNFSPIDDKNKATICIAAPFTALSSLKMKCQEKGILLGAQNMHDADEGAFTGEIAASMLVDLGVDFVLLGHSERRHLFHESSEFIQKKVLAALNAGLKPFVCVGETLQQRDEGSMEEVLKEQIESSLKDIPEDSRERIVLAYEPVWAIGTGQVATLKQAAEAHGICRDILKNLFGEDAADKVPILYGGSVKPDNAEALLQEPLIDGLLVGGASLSPETFSKIITCAHV